MSRAKAPDSEAWKSSPRAWAQHVEGYTHRRAVENSARKHGAQLGPRFLALLAARLVLVASDDEGTLEHTSALRMVNTWASEGPRAPRAKGKRPWAA